MCKPTQSRSVSDLLGFATVTGEKVIQNIRAALIEILEAKLGRGDHIVEL